MIRVSKAYYPVFFGFLFFISFNLNNINENLRILSFENLYFFILFFLLLIHIFLELFKLFNDVIPSRLFQVKLKNFLLKNNIKKFATYNSTFLDATITPMLDKFHQFEVEYVEKINDSKSEYFICPPLTSKSLSLETDKSAIKEGDLLQDPTILKLVEEKQLDKKSLKNFKTFASSKIFILESEVLSFRDLCLKDVKDFDRWLGLCRIFKLKKGIII